MRLDFWAQHAQRGDALLQRVVGNLVTLAPDCVHWNTQLRQRHGERPQRDQCRRVEPRMACIPGLDRECEGVGLRRVRDHAALEVGAMRLHQRLTGFVAHPLERDRRTWPYQPARAQQRQRAHALAVQQRDVPAHRGAEGEADQVVRRVRTNQPTNARRDDRGNGRHVRRRGRIR